MEFRYNTHPAITHTFIQNTGVCVIAELDCIGTCKNIGKNSFHNAARSAFKAPHYLINVAARSAFYMKDSLVYIYTSESLWRASRGLIILDRD